MADLLTQGGIEAVRAPDSNDPVTLQVGGLSLVKAGQEKYRARFTDGTEIIEAILTTQVGKRVASGEIRDLDILKLTGYLCNEVKGEKMVVATAVEVVAREQPPLHAQIGSASRPPVDATNATIKAEATSPAAIKPAKAESDTSASTPGPVVRRDSKENARPMEADGPAAAVATAAPAVTPASVDKPAAALRSAVPQHLFRTPGPTPSPSEEVRRTAASALRGPPTPPGSARKTPQPIAALNPYNMNWTIKARVSNKAPKRSFTNKNSGEVKSVCSIEVVDDQGTAIEATLWGECADKYYDVLEEGKVYFISRGRVKPANKNYAAVRNDYTINLDDNAEIEECEAADASKMHARPNFVSIEALPTFLGKKALVDLLGVVTAVGPLGSVKRKTDQSELQRRDLTLLDQSRKTVSLTIWGTSADELAALEGRDAPILSITACRVTDFNGVSVSSLQRSHIRVDPDDLPEAQKLRAWYEADGRDAAVSAIGEGLGNSRGSGGGTKRATLRGMQKPPGELPPADAKPEYFTCTGTVTFINPEQTMYYMAAPENNRKVTPQNGGYFCEYDGKTYDRMERRYVLLLKASDESGEAYLNMFNDQAAELLGMSADALAELKEGSDPAVYASALKAAYWTDWSFKIQTRTREYNGELRQRCSVSGMQPLDYAAECGHLLREIARYTAAAA